ncbi:uncharacterized protein LOC141691923 [Apium graveolens]|uniref:uncharacterized protein LOC141691923 n=1 Tax=Apium graveolens TaxID=4045 RepID=UPI003D7C0E63
MYFPNTDFLNAKLGDNASYTWRSILSAQEVLKKGCRRSIGTGKDTFVWKIHWLPCTENGYLTTIMPQELEGIRVCDLMEGQQRRWDDDILEDLFNSRDVRLLKNVPLSIRDINDSWLWLFDEKDQFTVKSCYRKLVGECDTFNAVFWRKIWDLTLPGKVGFFLWRTCRACLPAARALVNKGVNIDDKCGWCQVEKEDEMHVLFECQFARRCGHQLNRRNKWLWNRVAVSVFGTTSAATNLLEDWKKAQLEKPRSKSRLSATIRRWQIPQRGWVKINMDAAVFEDINTIGVGGVI